MPARMREPTGEIREPQGVAARAARTAAAFARDNWRGYLTAAAAGVFLAAVGAFGMEPVPLVRRLLYWVPLMLAGGVIGSIASHDGLCRHLSNTIGVAGALCLHRVAVPFACPTVNGSGW